MIDWTYNPPNTDGQWLRAQLVNGEWTVAVVWAWGSKLSPRLGYYRYPERTQAFRILGRARNVMWAPPVGIPGPTPEQVATWEDPS